MSTGENFWKEMTTFDEMKAKVGDGLLVVHAKYPTIAVVEFVEIIDDVPYNAITKMEIPKQFITHYGVINAPR